MPRPIHPITIEHVRAALALAHFDPVPAQLRMIPVPRTIFPENVGQPVRQAGVLVLLYPDADRRLQIVLIHRTAVAGDHHSGQISFPGGRRDPGDQSFQATALRETCEEIGVCSGIAVLGQLSEVYIPPSHYCVHPSVGLLGNQPLFTPNEEEVAEVFTLPIDDLIDPSIKRQEFHEFRGQRVKISCYLVKGHKVWGATAVMLSEFEQRLQAVLDNR